MIDPLHLDAAGGRPYHVVQEALRDRGVVAAVVEKKGDVEGRINIHHPHGATRGGKPPAARSHWGAGLTVLGALRLGGIARVVVAQGD